MKKHLMALLLLVSLLCTVLSGCGGGSQNGTTGTTDQSTANTQTEGPAARAAAGELNVGIAQDLDSSLDPHKTVKAGTREVMFNVFEGLMKPTPEGDLTPAIASDYQVSEDRLTYTFTLRDGVKFHNGDTVTAEDVVFSIQEMVNNSTGGKATNYSACDVDGITTPDDYTVEIPMKEDNSAQLS